MKRYYETVSQAKKALKEELKQSRPKVSQDATIYDLGRHRKRRYFIGIHIEWLNLN